jgi:hypothetical protein
MRRLARRSSINVQPYAKSDVNYIIFVSRTGESPA